MKYILLMQYAIQDLNTKGVPAWTPEDVQGNQAFLKKFHQELTEAGELVQTVPLVHPGQTRLVTARKGAPPVISDGPFPETKEFVGGFWMIDVDGPDRAYEVAARLSTLPGQGGVAANMPIEVRQVMDHRASGEA